MQRFYHNVVAMKIAIVQMDCEWENPTANCKKVLKWVDESQDAEFVIFPEMFSTGFTMHPEEVAENRNGATVTFMKELAMRSGKALMGSIATKTHTRTGERGYVNRLYFFAPDGIVLSYDKRHVFRMGYEHKKYFSGTSRTIIYYKGVRICPMVCYDLRFPVWSRIKRNDYDVLVYVAAWPEARRYAWNTLLKARAIENLSYVVGVNRVGSDPNIEYAGDSVVLDYLGQPMVEIEPYKEGITFTEIDMDTLAKYREEFPAYLDADNFKIV